MWTEEDLKALHERWTRDRRSLRTPEQLAQRIQVSPRTVRRWLADRRMPGMRMGDSWRIYPEILENPAKWINDVRGRKGENANPER